MSVHVKTCLNLFRLIMIRIVTIHTCSQTCPNMTTSYVANWYDCIISCHLWYDSQTCLILFRINVIWIITIHMRFIWFSNMSEHVQTCLNLFRINMIWIYTILKYCQNMMKYTKCLWCNLIQSYHFLSSLKSYLNMSRLVLNHNMMKYSNIWANGGKKVDDDDEAIPWTASTSERSKIKISRLITAKSKLL